MSQLDVAAPEGALCRPPREAWPLARVLGLVLMKMGRAGPPFEPRRRSQAGKSRDPRSQNADNSPRAQDAPGLDRAERRKGKGEAPWALTACGLGRRVAVDWTWAALFPHASSFCTLLCGLAVVHSRSPFCCSTAPYSSFLRTPTL